jgi:MFS family permease
MNSSPKLKLFVMMVLQFFIWGAWLPLIFGYLPSLGFAPGQQAWILNAFPIAAIVGMFFSNQFADRNFAGEKFLAFSHLVGGVAILGLAFVNSPPEAVKFMAENPKAVWNPHAPFVSFFGLMLIHCLFYVPTISITNSIAFTHMKDAQQEFGIVRMGGTIGWILAAWPFTFIFVDWSAVSAANPEGLAVITEALKHPLTGDAAKAATKWTYVVAGVASLLLAGFSLALPHTPPRKAEGGIEGLAWLEALKLLKHPFILVLWLVTLVDSAVHNSYFMWTGAFLGTPADKGGVGVDSNLIMPVMSIGQIAEILTMFVLGATLKNLGWKWTMTLGILGHAARFGVYAFFPQHKELIILVQVLHGICYAFFFATVYIFVEEFFPKDARASAQGLFNVMILGIGLLVAATVCPQLFSSVTKDGVTNFHQLFLIPLGLAVAAAVLLALFFNPPAKASAGADEPPKQPH